MSDKLSGLAFGISGTLSETKKSVEAKIKQAGGKVTAKITRTTTHLITTREDYESGTNEKVKDAITKRVHIVTEEYLNELLTSASASRSNVFLEGEDSSTLKVGKGKKRKATKRKKASTDEASDQQHKQPRPAKVTTPEHDAKMAALTFASVYPNYIAKVEKKGRTVQELHQVIEWLTGFNPEQLRALADANVTFRDFFAQATLNPNVSLIKGLICGYKVQEIPTQLTREVRYLDKLVEELARGKRMEKILRKP